MSKFVPQKLAFAFPQSALCLGAYSRLDSLPVSRWLALKLLTPESNRANKTITQTTESQAANLGLPLKVL